MRAVAAARVLHVDVAGFEASAGAELFAVVGGLGRLAGLELVGFHGRMVDHEHGRVKPARSLRGAAPRLGGGAWVLRGATGFCRPWHGCRELLESLGDRVPVRERERVSDAMRVAVEPRTRLPSFMSHSPAISRALHEAWIELLIAARVDRPIALIAAPLIDVASLAVFRGVAARGAIELLIDDELARPEPLHAGRSFDLGHTALSMIFASFGRGDPVSVEADVVSPAFEQEDERALWRDLEAGREVEGSRWLATLLRCFDLQGFSAVLAFSEYLDRFSRELDRAALAEVHTLIGLSAYARHVESSGSEQIGEFMAEHFSRALELEDDGARHAALSQRMSMVAARRRGHGESAMHWARAAIAESASLGSDAAKFVGAWSRNAHAYVLARGGALSQARATMEQAFEQLLEISCDSADVPRGERALSELAFADNRIELALLAGDRARASELSDELCERERMQGGEAYLANVRRIRMLAAVPERTRECVDLAREAARGFARSASPVDELECTARLADAAERLGFMSESVVALERCLALRSELSSESACDATRVRLARTLWRGGRSDDARARLLLVIDRTDDAALAAVARALLARITADLEGRRAAEQLADTAIDAATELGDAHTVLRVGLWLIDVCETIGDRESAAVLIEEAQRTLEAFPDSATPGQRAWLAASCGDPAALGERFNLDTALAEPELWWRLDALAQVLSHAGDVAGKTRCAALAHSRSSITG